MIDPRRLITLRQGSLPNGPVAYWMNRDQRVEDNWAFIFARHLALERKLPLFVVFTLWPLSAEEQSRQYDFMLKGLQEVERTLREMQIPYFQLSGNPPQRMKDFVFENDVATVVSDFNPLRTARKRKQDFLIDSDVEFHTVDAHNIVPAFYVSNKQEYGAATLRPKIKRLLDSFLIPFPDISGLPDPGKTDEINRESLPPGGRAARAVLDDFMDTRVQNYELKRNDPNSDAQSNLSPYLHFGQISAQRVALEIQRDGEGDENRSAFLEELIVRRELSDNYCLYNPEYDNLKNIPAWAGKTLEDHRRDEREFTYELKDFEAAKTHESLWNAAQNEMVRTGKMHGYMRMYWAKKILEWSDSPEAAMATAVYLNDRYQLDGKDPNGYAGCAWSIAGVHDRAWQERPVYGKIRYMNENGCRRKFDVDSYIRKWLE